MFNFVFKMVFDFSYKFFLEPACQVHKKFSEFFVGIVTVLLTNLGRVSVLVLFSFLFTIFIVSYISSARFISGYLRYFL